VKIKVRLSDVGLRDAERQIQAYKATLNQKAQELAKALAGKGLDVAKVRFANAQYAGSNDVSCHVEQNGAACFIIAEGKSVAFIEFGTGVHHNGGVLAVTSRINVYRQITVFLYLHTRKLLDVAVIDFTSNEDAGDLLSQFLSNSREDGIEIIDQLFQTSLHVAST